MSEKKEFESLYEEYLSAKSKRDLKLIGSLYAEDAIYIAANSHAVEVRKAINTMYKDPPPEDLEVILNRVEVENNLAWVHGIGRWNEDGQCLGIEFIDIWRRNSGTWQISACIVNSSDGFPID